MMPTLDVRWKNPGWDIGTSQDTMYTQAFTYSLANVYVNKKLFVNIKTEVSVHVYVNMQNRRNNRTLVTPLQ